MLTDKEILIRLMNMITGKVVPKYIVGHILMMKNINKIMSTKPNKDSVVTAKPE